MNLKPLAVVVASLLGTAGASAATYAFTMPLSPATPFSSFVQVSAPGMFTDFWNFTAPVSAVQASSATISIDLAPFANIDMMQVALFNGSNATGSLVASGATGESSELQNIAITGGNMYSFRVTGSVANAATGYYTFAAIAAPIPEPSTYAMFAAGMVAISLVVMRRRQA